MRRRICILLIITNVVSLTAFVGLAHYCRVPGKLYRRLVGESRIPFVTEPHRINRYYDGQRQLFKIYARGRVHTLILGDSLVSLVSWAELLGNADVPHRGIPGDTTAGLLSRIDDYSSLSLNVCVLFVGTNDVLLDRPENETLREYAVLLDRCRTIWPSARILCVTVPPVSTWAETAEAKNERIMRFNLQIQQIVMKTDNAAKIDLSHMFMNQNGYLAESMTTDGVHLSAQAYAVLRDQILPCIPAAGKGGVD